MSVPSVMSVSMSVQETALIAPNTVRSTESSFAVRLASVSSSAVLPVFAANAAAMNGSASMLSVSVPFP